jgi:hypothetical protein
MVWNEKCKGTSGFVLLEILIETTFISSISGGKELKASLKACTGYLRINILKHLVGV